MMRAGRINLPFGIRTLRIDPYHGLRINGETVKLRGACIHHDNGLLGAAAIEKLTKRGKQEAREMTEAEKAGKARAKDGEGKKSQQQR